MRVVRLSESFYDAHADHDEILKKADRPYACITLDVDGIRFAVPFRHNISHGHSFLTGERKGLDYSKAVVVAKDTDIGGEAWVDGEEWKIVKRNEDKVWAGMRKYLNQYRRAMRNRDNPRSSSYLTYSALQYFEDYL